MTGYLICLWMKWITGASIPCKILAFAENPGKEGDVWVLVHGCKYRESNLQTRYDTVLLEFWQLAYHDISRCLPAQRRKKRKDYMAPLISWVKVDALVARCLVVEEEPGIFEVVPLNERNEERNWVMLVRQHCRWPEEFTN